MQAQSFRESLSKGTLKTLINHFGEDGPERVERVLMAIFRDREIALDPAYNGGVISSFKNNPRQLEVVEKALNDNGQLPLPPDLEIPRYSTRNNGGTPPNVTTSPTVPKTGSLGDLLQVIHPPSQTEITR